MRGGVLIGLMLSVGFLTGCGGGKGFVGVNDGSALTELSGVKLAQKKSVPPPTITDISVSPTTLEFFGGAVHIQARIAPKKKKDAVTANAVITRQSDSQTFNAALSKTQGKTFAGDFRVPANLGSATQIYTVVIQATDNRPDAGRPSTAAAGTFSVRGIVGPPSPP